ncbi:MAG: aminotransferase class V-fold PLP-dependent enzyme [Gemmatimonadales bacterium]|nr:aminotransferase class V-fold PLP-dependent enzyme [Gemmatimonadales bacterium]
MMPPAMTPTISAWRAETDGADRLVHLNNAGAALAPRPVIEAVDAHLRLERELGGYEAADARRDEIAAAHTSVARVLGAPAGSIAMVQNATAAFAHALDAFDFQPGDRILTSRADYVSNQIMYLSLARRRGVEIVRAPDGPAGGIDPDAVRRLIARQRPVLVALTWVPTNSGLVQPVEAVGELCRAAEVPYLVDACQAAGQLPVDVTRLGCDYLAGTARKFLRGPRGVGFLYVSERTLAAGAHPLLLDMRGATWSDPDDFTLVPDALRFESWEISYALVLGLGAAADYALKVGIETGGDRARALAAYARNQLASLPGVRVLDRGPELCAIVTADLGVPADAVMTSLRARRINTSSAEREDAVIDMDEKGTASVLRISPHYYNTAEEVDAAVGAIGESLRGKLSSVTVSF